MRLSPPESKEENMVEVKGEYMTVLCYTDKLEELAHKQIQNVCNRNEYEGCKLRIMPDVHAGKGCTIGTTLTIRDKVVPGMVGVDIGCGMETIRLIEKKVDFAKLDQLIRDEIPCGFNVRKTRHPYLEQTEIENLRCKPYVNMNRAELSIGTLGGGNHFIEVDRGTDDSLYLVIHSGSRHLGTQVCEYYQEEGYNALCGSARFQLDDIMARLKKEGRFKEIQPTIDALKTQHTSFRDVPKDLAYVEGQLFEDYIHDMRIVQKCAMMNRQAMVDVIMQGMGWHEEERFSTIHNYIDMEAMILRKGAVSAKAGEKLLIPINMREGSLICIGKGNDEWNCSAPHGAGRIMSRKEAFQTLSMDEYAKQMEGIYTTYVQQDTLDEAPMAYKPVDEILEQIKPTADVIERIKPVYNFKAVE